MAGGGGTRLWPLSRRSRPKQMLTLGGHRSLFQMAVDRLGGLLPPERILVVTVAEQAAALQAQVPEIPKENYLLEPMPRGTASVVGLAAVALHARDEQAVMAVLTADHYIDNETEFHFLLQDGVTIAREGYLVTLGIPPTYPATGYGYIQRGKRAGAYGHHIAYSVVRFKEKPSEDLARKFIKRGDHDWNSGMFIWSVSRILEEFQAHMPDFHAHLTELSAHWDARDRDAVVREVWTQITPQTIDYGIMEKTDRAMVIPANELGWNDVGSWDSLFDVLPSDENGNIVIGKNILDMDSRDSLVHGENSDRMIVTIGVRDLVVVDAGDVILICPKTESQKVRQMVAYLKQQNKDEYL
ncbi:MAG: NTP transferase domain-containing protein [Anaerolineae bacterium]|nr:NTP transferase domain-containing protein [Anaerolineae bacterium]